MIPSSPTTEQAKGTAWHNRSAEEVLAELGSKATGLSATEAVQRLAANGPNRLQEGKRISSLQMGQDGTESQAVKMKRHSMQRWSHHPFFRSASPTDWLEDMWRHEIIYLPPFNFQLQPQATCRT